ncbi:hypothetical protein ALC60_02261 [Trachymyrmex zeteki]|uniref:Uncharacterized protein n=1 Tax=Mycetomoellerius zeteki TaxID=64791 RepID=A0A151XE11_9HYME|nr:hypothetical protein ALC60_02261 [Trachymyrmex zeteki]
MLPKRPPNAATITMGHCGAANCSTAVSTVTCHCIGFLIFKVKKIYSFIPQNSFLPLGTFFLVVMRKGSLMPITVPSSEAHVSPLQHADAPNIDCYLLFQWITMNFDIPCRSQLAVLRFQYPTDIIRLIV